MSHKHDQTNAFFELCEIALRHRWRFIAPAFVVCAAVLAVGLVLPRKYQAEAQFERRTDMVLTEITTKGAPRSFQDPRSTLIEQLSGQPAIDRLFEKIAPELRQHGHIQNHYDEQTLRSDVARRVVVNFDIATGAHDRVRVGYVGPDPDFARRVVNTLVTNYITRTRAAMDERLRGSAAFFQNEVDRSRSVIENLENKTLEFEVAHGELLPENPNNLQTRIVERREYLDEMIGKREGARMRVEALDRSLAQEPATIPSQITARNPELVRLEQKRRDLREKLGEFTGALQMTDRHPDLVALRSRIAEVDARIAGTETHVVIETQTIVNPKLADLDLRLTTASSEYEAFAKQTRQLEAQLAVMETEAAKVFEVRGQYLKLTRGVNQAQRQLAFWEDNLRRIEMALAAESGRKGVQLNFIRPAEAAHKPVSPNLAQVWMAAIGMGLLAGALGVFFAHRAADSFYDGEHAAETLGLQLFGSVSEIISRRHRRMRRFRQLVMVPTNAVVMGSVLIGLGALLYLNLEKPAVFTDLKRDTARWVTGDETENE